VAGTGLRSRARGGEFFSFPVRLLTAREPTVLEVLRDSEVPFVAFVGAGASAIPPSRLPTWKGFNDLLLECLCERLDEYTRNRQPTAQMLEAFRARRDQTRFLSPDFQAQLMEEEVGVDYFAVWQSLDTDAYGPVHAGLAELAANGRLTAIITTNFDRLIETALRGRGVKVEVYGNAARFAELSAAKGAPDTLPIIKIHGSIEDASSLVDTLRQRMAGRPPALNEVLQVLLRRSPWMYLGFSGADFSYNPRYLGVLDAAAEAAGFVFVRQPGRELTAGVVKLVEAYGPAKAATVEAELSTWLADTFALQPWQAGAALSDADATARVKRKIREWVDKLGSIAVVNIVCAMLKSAGLQREAFFLLRRTFRSYRTPDDTKVRSYQRYNYNYGVALFEAGLISNPVALAEDMSNLSEWKEYADQNAFEFLARGYRDGGLLSAGGALASVMAYRGEVGKAIHLAGTVTDEAIRREAWLELCDVAVASVALYDIVSVYTAGAEQLRLCIERATALGDEPRRALLCAHRGRLLTYGRRFAEADIELKEAETIAARLDMYWASLVARAARGLWLGDSGTSAEAGVPMLQGVVDELRAFDDVPLVSKLDLNNPGLAPTLIKGRNPLLCRVLLDLTLAALAIGRSDIINPALDQLDELTVEHFPGYVPHYYFLYAQCLLQADPSHPDKPLQLVAQARKVGETSQNPWVAQFADHLEPIINARK